MAKKSDTKREFILAMAKKVFIRKGFTAVTMKDIIDECAISRGGIYLYFTSVDEIFMNVILAHSKLKLAEAHENTLEDKSFKQVIDDYFAKQKNRLLNMDTSLLMAMHEYRFTHKSEQDRQFYYNQFLNTKEIVLELLKYGVEKHAVSGTHIEQLAMTIMFFIEGISTMATAMVLTEDIIDSQIEFIKNIIFDCFDYNR